MAASSLDYGVALLYAFLQHSMETQATILAVDDNEAHRYFIARTLEQSGYKTVCVCDGKSALAEAQKKPDLILLDVHLPDMDGFQVCRKLKADSTTSQIPVVMFSAVAQNGAAVNDARQLGVSSFLFFPMDASHLLMAVQGSLAKVRQQGSPQ